MNEDVANALCSAEVLSFGNYQLSSGKKSQYYINLRILPSHPDVFDFISASIAQIVSQLGVDVIAGAEPNGVPLASGVALKTHLPAIFVKRAPRRFISGPMPNLIVGKLVKGQKVVLVTDLITNGYIKGKIIDEIKKAGGVVENIIAIIDKEEGAEENLAEQGIKLQSLIKVSELIEHMKANSLVDEETYNKVIASRSEEPSEEFESDESDS